MCRWRTCPALPGCCQTRVPSPVTASRFWGVAFCEGAVFCNGDSVCEGAKHESQEKPRFFGGTFFSAEAVLAVLAAVGSPPAYAVVNANSVAPSALHGVPSIGAVRTPRVKLQQLEHGLSQAHFCTLVCAILYCNLQDSLLPQASFEPGWLNKAFIGDRRSKPLCRGIWSLDPSSAR